jgi:hypothetical protein
MKHFLKITTWSRGLLEQITETWLFKKLPAFIEPAKVH